MPGYRTRQDSVEIDGAASLLIRSLLDRQQFADPHGHAADVGISSAAWPLFGCLWPASLHLAAHMAQRVMVADERILEVGCGLALASLVAHRRGSDVTASDCHPLAAGFLRENLRLNAMAPMAYRHGHWGSASGGAPVHGEARVEGRFGLIIGSDVLYERDEAGHLAAFIERHALPRAEVHIVDPSRGNRSAFHRRMAEAGFALRETRVSADPGAARMLRYTR